MSEFTGERVIPGEVDDNLWAEHVARYALASRFAHGRRVLDLGCGTGYGTADLARVAAEAVGVDLAPDAIAYAVEHFPSARFIECSASAVPVPPASFDLVSAFEVIEHLRDWRALLTEARRVLEPHGLLIVSTPNKRYYAEARANSGPNPFHEHEFELAEFRTALAEFFPHVQILFQDRVEAFAFHGGTSTPAIEADLARSSSDPQSASFFIGFCSCAPLPQLPALLYVPRAANLLREREEHIRLLENELAQVRTWLDQTTADRNELLTTHAELQKHFASEQTRAAEIISDLNDENRRKTEWALETERRLTAEVEKRADQLAEAVRLLDRAEATVVERTDWARRIDTRLQQTAAQLAMVRQSRWLKLGRKLGLGPQVERSHDQGSSGMKRFLAGAWRLLRGLPLALLSPLLLVLTAVGLLLSDLVGRLIPRKKLPPDTAPDAQAASVVIPNWNGRDLLEKYLPSVIAALSGSPQNEIIVVDNGSEDGGAQYLRESFPQVRVIALDKNLGFGGGSNAGFQEARNDIVVLLNSDMRVERDFLQPLLNGFTDEKTFAVSCQIFFSDSTKAREETGLTEGSWLQGGLKVRHRAEPTLTGLYPCFYGGGGSCAFDRKKFLALGGFDHLLKPFYLEDTDLGYLAWKRGWKVLYQPASVVYHEHRGTIGKRFSDSYIQAVLKKNFLLFTWKNIHDWRWLTSHFFFTWAGATLSWVAGDSPERPSFSGILRAFLALPRALVSRSQARALATVSDREAFRRPLGGHYRDTFVPLPSDPARLAVLFVSPYPICPPVHGGAVFMYQTVRELARLCDLHLIVLLDNERDREAHAELDRICVSTEYIVRMEGRQKALGSAEPHAFREFRNRDLAWLIHRQIYTHSIDVLQLEYLVMGQYAGGFHRIPSILFEHDIYFQSIARRLPHMASALEKIVSRWEYLRAIRSELKLLPQLERVQVCSRDNADYIRSFLPEMNGRLDDGYRAGINTSGYEFRPSGREPFTLLFLGSFRHLPNVEALQWFLQEVFPRIRKDEPRARLVIVGSDPPPRHSLRDPEAIEMIGFVEDVREPLMRYSLFVCPILAGSGVRVKLLEAFAAGIPVVSTRLGAEGLADKDGEICALADDPAEFAAHVIHLLRHPQEAEALARRARADVIAKRDMRVMTERLVECYEAEVRRMRQGQPAAIAAPALTSGAG